MSGLTPRLPKQNLPPNAHPHARDLQARQCWRSPALKTWFLIWLPFRITWRAGKALGWLGLTSKQLSQNLSVENQAFLEAPR